MAGDPGSTRIWIGNFLLEGISRGDTEHSSYASETWCCDLRSQSGSCRAGRTCFGRATTHLSSIILSLRAFWHLNRFAKRKDLQTQELAKGEGRSSSEL